MPVLQQQQKMQIGNGNTGKALESIRNLAKILDHFDILTLSEESQNPAKDLLDDEHVADLICYRLAESTSGRGNDEMCQWLFDTYQTEDMELQAVVLRFIPTLCGLYLPHAVSCPDEPLAGFEAVLLALYATELRARNGAPLLINIPSLSQPSPYHTPHKTSRSSAQLQQVGEVSSALEPQVAIKSTKRASIVGVALELFWRRIVAMPLKAKLDLCHYAKVWAVQGCSWVNDVDAISKLTILPSQSISTSQSEAGVVVSTPDSPTAANYHEVGEFQYPGDQLDAPRVTLDQDILRPIFKVLGHCLMGPTSPPELRAAAVDAARALYVRASHALNPEAILASRSLLRLHAAALVSSR
ncbi:unnamed protein product [Sphagnum jensenii]|uniref:Hyccin n=1 Tax=Sphagnum jensenii TaxID=128206 RepID=A0ABP1BYQ4_9BRYO